MSRVLSESSVSRSYAILPTHTSLHQYFDFFSFPFPFSFNQFKGQASLSRVWSNRMSVNRPTWPAFRWYRQEKDQGEKINNFTEETPLKKTEHQPLVGGTKVNIPNWTCRHSTGTFWHRPPRSDGQRRNSPRRQGRGRSRRRRSCKQGAGKGKKRRLVRVHNNYFGSTGSGEVYVQYL